MFDFSELSKHAQEFSWFLTRDEGESDTEPDQGTGSSNGAVWGWAFPSTKPDGAEVATVSGDQQPAAEASQTAGSALRAQDAKPSGDGGTASNADAVPITSSDRLSDEPADEPAAARAAAASLQSSTSVCAQRRCQQHVCRCASFAQASRRMDVIDSWHVAHTAATAAEAQDAPLAKRASIVVTCARVRINPQCKFPRVRVNAYATFEVIDVAPLRSILAGKAQEHQKSFQGSAREVPRQTNNQSAQQPGCVGCEP